MARNRPVMICSIKQAPNNDPKFHQMEMLDGLGRSISELLMILIIGWVFRRLVAIKFL